LAGTEMIEPSRGAAKFSAGRDRRAVFGMAPW
jgi:hypothetical protein